MLLKIHPKNPEDRKINQVVTAIEKGAVIIYPAGAVYGFGCDIHQKKAIERICRLRNLDPNKANLTIICANFSQLAEYAQQIDNQLFKLLKKNLPGQFTFILKAHSKIPKIFKAKRKTIGIRIPTNPIAMAILEKLGHPLLSISLKSDEQDQEYLTDPDDIYDKYKKLVDIVIDAGIGGNIPTTIVDCTDGEIQVIRQGVGVLQ